MLNHNAPAYKLVPLSDAERARLPDDPTTLAEGIAIAHSSRRSLDSLCDAICESLDVLPGDDLVFEAVWNSNLDESPQAIADRLIAECKTNSETEPC